MLSQSAVKITSIRPLLLDRYLIVKIETDSGITGIGESGAHSYLDASATAVHTFAAQLKGRDALAVEHHWNFMQRANHMTGAAIMGAVSAIDTALWDIRAKALGVPIWHLLGGPTRQKARVYAHAKGKTADELVRIVKIRKDEGFTAIGHLNPFLDEEFTPYFKPHARKMAEAIETVRRLREAVGNDVDLCLELHRRLTVPEAVAFGLAIEPFFPMFYEDPIPPFSGDAMAFVANSIRLPIATGERFSGLHAFEALMARSGVQFLRTCLGICGGITGTKKIAAMAEARQLQLAPHNSVSPVTLMAELQIAASIPNFAIQEYPTVSDAEGRAVLPAADMFVGLPQVRNGFIDIPTAPGLGLELVEDAEKKFPQKPKPRANEMRLHLDGSVVEY
jgi:galactonate dehydratase